MSVNLVKYFYQFLQTVGKNDETAPTSDTAPAGQNGRLQRLAQHLSTVINSLSTANTAHTATNTKLDTISTHIVESEVLLTDIKTLLTRPNITTDNVIVAKTGSETSPDIQLTKANYAFTAFGLAEAETVKIQVKDVVTGQYFDYITLTASAPVATIQNLPVTIRIVKSVTANDVGINSSYQ